MDYKKFYELESYLFGEVADKFSRDGKLNAFDFFCVIIWKSNRSKSKIAALLLKKSIDLETAAATLTSDLAQRSDSKGKMELLIVDWGFKLPIASAALTVLFKDEFTIYDYRVCQQLGGFHQIADYDFDEMWLEYEKYVNAVKAAATSEANLRNKDRWLWGQSFYTQLQRDIENRFENLREQARNWIESLPIGTEFEHNDVYNHLETNFPDRWDARGSESCREDAQKAVKASIDKKIVQKKPKRRFMRVQSDQRTP